ncbi:MAG: phospholipid carrier-dependent glycosyltransferase [Terriglobales bacterium]|jgi:dolichyl-phosphate-mannose--protein O-mannosyl transferase
MPQEQPLTRGDKRTSSLPAVEADVSHQSSKDHAPRLPIWMLMLVALGGLALFLPRIAIPQGFIFDEVFYVPGARDLLGEAPRLAIPEGEVKESQRRTASVPEGSHPPLGKFLIAAGIAVAGDNSLGWRLMSAVAGALSLTAIYLWTWLLLGSPSLALWAAAMSAVNNLLFVMARVGMLDIFCVLFLLWALVAVTAVLQQQVSWRAGLAGAGIFFGLAIGCKWLALAPLAASFCLLILWSCRSSLAESNGTKPLRWSPMFEAIAGLVVVPAIVYVATFVPLAWRIHQPFSLGWFLEQQLNVIHRHVGHQGPPVQVSHFYSWPFKISPEVFYYGGESRFILLLGNPLVLWTGVVAVVFLCYRLVAAAFLQRKLGLLFSSHLSEVTILLAYASLFSLWAIAPRKTMFYHYYFPAAMTLAPALAVAFARMRPKKIFGLEAHSCMLLGASLVFLVFFPGLAAIQTGSGWIMQFFFS